MRPYLRPWIAGIVQLHHYCLQQSLLLSFAITDSAEWQADMLFHLLPETQAEFAQPTNNAADSQDRPTRSVIFDFADVTRPNKLGDFIRRQRSSANPATVRAS